MRATNKVMKLKHNQIRYKLMPKRRRETHRKKHPKIRGIVLTKRTSPLTSNRRKLSLRYELTAFIYMLSGSIILHVYEIFANGKLIRFEKHDCLRS